MINKLTNDELKSITSQIDVLRLIRTQNIGIKTFFDLIKIYKTPAKVLEELPRLAQNGGAKKYFKVCSTEEAIFELERIEQYGAKLITIFDGNYPEQLKNIYDPPPVITTFGDQKLLSKRIAAIVGSRNSTANGCRIAYKFAKELGEKGFVIISGLAKGIDAAAHKGAIRTGTIAVIAGGIDNIYPPENSALYQEIKEQGIIISELPFGMIPKSQHFPQRNRLISGLSEGVLVIEASIKSGSLITARFALEHNREVFAVPGFPLEPRCQGTNELIKQGAHLVTSIDDITNVLDNNMVNIVPSNLREDDKFEYQHDVSNKEIEKVRRVILEKLSYTPVSVDDIVAFSNCSYQAVITALLELELAGRLLRYPGNKISLIFEEVSGQ